MSACPSPSTIGFPNGPSFTAVENESLTNRVVWQIRRCWSWFLNQEISPFVVHDRDELLSSYGYLLMPFVSGGRSLSSTFKEERHDDTKRQNLYHGVAKVLLTLAKMPLARAGSWTMGNQGRISLTNRPLLVLTMTWARHKIPTTIPRDMTYTSADSYINDMIVYQEDRLRHQPNAILGRGDGVCQLGVLMALKALVPRFWDHRTRNGPFVLTLPVLHQSNMLVDDDWNIIGLIDFEFAPVQPIQMIGVPHWLNTLGFDELSDDTLADFKSLYDEFVEAVEQEEKTMIGGYPLNQQLREHWISGKVWFNGAMESLNGFPIIFEKHSQPMFYDKFDDETDAVTLMRLWGKDCDQFIEERKQDKAKYDEDVRAIFAAARAAAAAATTAANGTEEDGCCPAEPSTELP